MRTSNQMVLTFRGRAQSGTLDELKPVGDKSHPCGDTLRAQGHQIGCFYQGTHVHIIPRILNTAGTAKQKCTIN